MAAGGGKKCCGNENAGGSARLEEEEEDRCIRLCSTDVETSSVSVEGKRKFAVRRAGLPAASVQLPLHIALPGFRSQIRMCFEAFSTHQEGLSSTLTHFRLKMRR